MSYARRGDHIKKRAILRKSYRSLAHSAGSAKQRDVRPTISEIEISETDKFGTTGTPFLNMVPPIDGARRSQKTFGPKTQENQIGIRPAYFFL